MKVKQSFKMAFKSLKASKMRSLLTMLGIIIGVAAVIILVSIVDGFSRSMTSTFESMGTNLLTVSVRGRNTNRAISPNEMQTIADENSSVIGAISPLVSMSATVKNGSTNITTSCQGINEFYGEIRNYEVSYGRFLKYLDVDRRQKVCVVGTYIVNELFGGLSPLNQEIKINGETFTVVGVLTEKQEGSEGSADDIIFIPYTAAIILSGSGSVQSYSISAATPDTVDEAKALVEAELYKTFGNTSSYSVFSQKEMLEQMDELTGTLALVLVGIAAISLLVGGIGIMNIMLVSVTERIKEIGIRKSVGAKRKDILQQFLIEAATTSAVGGVIGILFGGAVAVLLGNIIGLDTTPSTSAVIISFSVSVGIGIIFGYFPAGKAAKLNPIDALKFD